MLSGTIFYYLRKDYGIGSMSIDMYFWEHRLAYPELYVTEEENEKYNYDGRRSPSQMGF